MMSLSDYIIKNYSRDGVEVQSCSASSRMVKLSLPPRFDNLSYFCRDLEERWNAIVDLEYTTNDGPPCLAAKVWFTDTKEGPSTMNITVISAILVFFAVFVTSQSSENIQEDTKQAFWTLADGVRNVFGRFLPVEV